MYQNTKEGAALTQTGQPPSKFHLKQQYHMLLYFKIPFKAAISYALVNRIIKHASFQLYLQKQQYHWLDSFRCMELILELIIFSSIHPF